MNSNTSRASKISDEIWESHRHEIEKLYVQEGKELLGDVGVINLMKKNNGFVASKSQYEHRFKIWDLRKNLKRKEWPEVIQAVTKRKRLGKDSEVRLNGIMITRERIERETTRYGPVLKAQGETLQDRRVNLPKGIEICSPQMTPSTCGMVLQSPNSSPVRMNTNFVSPVLDLSPRFDKVYQAMFQSTFLPPVQYIPFGWSETLDWASLFQSTSIQHQIVRFSEADMAYLNTTFYPNTKVISNQVDQRTLIPKYFLSAMLNKLEPSGGPNLEEIYQWLRNIPQSIILQLLKNLPAHIMEVLRERVFMEACKAGDEITARTMLSLGLEPLQMIPSPFGTPTTPLQEALRWRNFHAAKFLLHDLCQIDTGPGPDALLYQLLSFRHGLVPDRAFSTLQWFELMKIPLDSGAKSTTQCFEMTMDVTEMTEYLLERGNGNVQGLLRGGLLGIFLDDYKRRDYSEYGRARLERVLKYFLEHSRSFRDVDGSVKISLAEAYRQSPNLWARELICEIGLVLGVPIALEQAPIIYSTIIPYTGENFERAISENDLSYLEKILDFDKSNKHSSYYLSPWLRKAAMHNHHGIVDALLNHLQNRFADYILPFIEFGRTVTLSSVVESDVRYTRALQNANITGSYSMLDDLLFRTVCADGILGFLDKSRQTVLRAISYHAIQTSNTVILKWLIDSGLEMDELWFELCDDDDLSVYNLATCGGEFLHSHDGHTDRKEMFEAGKMPSLLSVAAEQNNQLVTGFLLSEGAKTDDSSALMRAIRSKADTAVIQLLLEGSKIQRSSKSTNYGSSALRLAVREKNYDLIRRLVKKVDPQRGQSLRLVQHDFAVRSEIPEVILSPLGEAIWTGDLKAAEILLNNLTSPPNSLVTHQGDLLIEQIGSRSILYRLTPLLAAIDMQNLALVELLVRFRADIDYPPRQGLLRTPLQRAAEIGSFEIVKFLLKCGAPVDSEPFYNGATPLQLAAMGGFVGIATLLIENGAEVNFPPARGPGGRAAFEAAAERGRIDMLSLLVQRDVNLDHVFGEEEEDAGNKYDGIFGREDDFLIRGSQYHRALYCAEKRGEMATRKFIQGLYQDWKARFETRFDELPSSHIGHATDWQLEQFLPQVSEGDWSDMQFGDLP